MSSAVASTTYLVLGLADLPNLSAWRQAVLRRYKGCRVHPVVVGGIADADRFRYGSQFDCPKQAAQFIGRHRVGGDRVFMLVPHESDVMLAGFTNAGMYPTYVDTSRWTPFDLVAKAKLAA